jgi:SnoaL-like domain
LISIFLFFLFFFLFLFLFVLLLSFLRTPDLSIMMSRRMLLLLAALFGALLLAAPLVQQVQADGTEDNDADVEDIPEGEDVPEGDDDEFVDEDEEDGDDNDEGDEDDDSGDDLDMDDSFLDELAGEDDTGLGRGDFLQFQVEELLDTLESRNTEEIIKLFTDDATLVLNGETSEGTEAVTAALTTLFADVTHLRYSVLSPIHETGSRAHFVRNMYMESTQGCTAATKSIEHWLFNDEGKVTFMRSDWEVSTADFRTELGCGAVAKPKANTQSLVDTIYTKFVYPWSTLDASKINEFFADGDAVATYPGTENTVLSGAQKRDEITASVALMQSSRINPTTPIIATGDNSAVFIYDLFVVTKTGCSGTYEVVVYCDISGQQVTSYTAYIVGTTAQQFSEDLKEDCNAKAAEAENEPEEPVAEEH